MSVQCIRQDWSAPATWGNIEGVSRPSESEGLGQEKCSRWGVVVDPDVFLHNQDSQARRPREEGGKARLQPRDRYQGSCLRPPHTLRLSARTMLGENWLSHWALGSISWVMVI